MEDLKPGSIVRHKPTGVMYELVGTIGYVARVKSLANPPTEHALLTDDLEVIMDEPTLAFEVLFGNEPNDDT